MQHRPMPLIHIPEPFDHPDWLFELKHDGFRGLAYVKGHCCLLVSRRGDPFPKGSLARRSERRGGGVTEDRDPGASPILSA